MRKALAPLLVAFLAVPVPAQIAGSFTSSLEGCPDASLLYEQFPIGAFDLANGVSLDWLPNGGLGFIVARGISTFMPTTGGVNLGLGDDMVSTPMLLGFNFPYPTGMRSTQSVQVSSNGYVYLEPLSIASSRCCDASAQLLRQFREDTPSWAVLGMDLDPGTAGAVWFNTGPGVAYVTWDQVVENGQAVANTFQIQFWSNGQVSMIWNAATNLAHSALVGWSGGGGVDDDGSFDFSASPIYDMGASSGPLTISAPPARLPTLGKTFRIDMFNVPSTASIAGLIVGRQTTNVPLDSIGMTRCTLFSTGDITTMPMVVNPPLGNISFPIPQIPGLMNLVWQTQAAVVAPGVNQLGVAVSNLGTMQIGNIEPVVVRASGADNENSDDTTGFWQIVNATNLGIASVRFDWVAATVPNSNYFDTNQNGMADRFDGGNSTLPLCHGTYRNLSDLTVGLDHTGTPATPCGGLATTGWVGTNFGRNPGDYRTLDFRFLHFDPGEVFEFDADTDGGPGNGGAMAGMMVTVRMSDGSVRSGPLVFVDTNTSKVNL